MGEKIVNKVLDYIDTIGGIVSEGAKQGYMILVRQEFAKGIIYSLIATILMLIIGLLVKIVYKWYKNNKDTDDEATSGLTITVVLSFFATIGLLFLLGNGILHIVNPQYYAIQEILDTLK